MNVTKTINRTQNLKVLTPDQRNALVVSIAEDGHILSCFGDNVWDLSPYIHALGTSKCLKKIDFSTSKFKDNSKLIDQEHCLLLAGVKSYVYIRLMVKSPQKGKPLGGSSIMSMWVQHLRPLLRWMVDYGYSCFADLSPDACMAYVEYTKNTSYRDLNNGRRKKVSLSAKTLNRHFSCLESLWHFREHIEDALIQHPWPNMSAYSIAGYSTVGGENIETEQIPDRLMSKLVQGALYYVEEGYGTRLLDCRDAKESGDSIKSHFTPLGLKNWKQVTIEISYILTACYIIIDAFSGMRASEVLSLKIGCYYEHEGWDGATYGWLKGITYKLEEYPKQVEWMVPPVVERAVNLAVRTTAPLRIKLEMMISELEDKLRNVKYMNENLRQNDSQALNEMKKQRLGLFIGLNRKFFSINVTTNATTLIRLRKFAIRLDLRVDLADLEQVRNKTKIRVGEIWPLNSQQFRRTFARYVARCVLGDVRYLREHFKHWSLDMTLGYAWNEDDLLDTSLIDEILEEHHEIQSDVVYGWVDFKRNQHLAANGGKNIEKARESCQAIVATDPRAVARQLARGYFLRGLGHSWCTEKECNGKGIYSVIECKDCENRVIDESHIPMWYGIRDQQIELMMLDDCGDPMWQGALESLRYAEKILADLGEKIVPYQAPSKPSERRINV